MNYDDYRSYDPMRRMGTTAEPDNYCEPPEEPEETPEYLWLTCKTQETCKRHYDARTEGDESPWEWCRCDLCEFYEYEYGRTLV